MFHGASESPAPPSFMPTRRWPPRFGLPAATAAAVPRKPGTVRIAPTAAERSRSSRRVSPGGTSLMLVPLSVPDPGIDPTAARKRASSAWHRAPARVGAVVPPARAGVERAPVAAVGVHDEETRRAYEVRHAARDDPRAIRRPRGRHEGLRPATGTASPHSASLEMI